MLGKIRDAIRIQTALANKGLKVTPLEAYDSWVRYSLIHGEPWINIRKKEKDETIYRKVRHHIASLDETPQLLKVKDQMEIKLTELSQNLGKLSKSELNKFTRFKNIIFNLPGFSKAPIPVKN